MVNAVQSGSIPFEALDVVFWNALFAEQGWFFVDFFKKTMTLNKEQSAAFASKLSTIVFLSTDQPNLPGDLAASLLIRLIQLEVAATNRDERLFQAIAEAAVREAGLFDIEQVKEAMRIMVLSKILFAQGGRLDWATRLAWVADYDALSKSNPILAEQAEIPAIRDLKVEFGDVAELPGFLLTIGLQSIRSPEDLQALFNALDDLDEKARHRWLDQLRAFSKGYDLYIQAAWSNAWISGDLDSEKSHCGLRGHGSTSTGLV